MYLLDANILIEFLRGRSPDGLELLNNTDVRIIKVPSIVKAELLVGAYKSAKVQENVSALESLICNYEELPFDSRCARIYAKIRAELELKGRKIGPNDLLIAATALAHDAVLITNNAKEFKCVPGIRLMSLGEAKL